MLNKPAAEPLVREGGVLGAVIDKRPAQCGLEECLGGLQVLRREFDVIDFFVFVHGISNSVGALRVRSGCQRHCNKNQAAVNLTLLTLPKSFGSR